MSGGENAVIDDVGDVWRLTVREAAAVQTFPADYVFSGRGDSPKMRQIGNAVPVDLAGIVLGAAAAVGASRPRG